LRETLFPYFLDNPDKGDEFIKRSLIFGLAR